MYFIVLWISYVFLCFFDLLFLLFFLAKFVADTFWSTIMLKQTRCNLSCWQIKVIYACDILNCKYDHVPDIWLKIGDHVPIVHSLSYNIQNFGRKWSYNNRDAAQRSLPCRFMFGKKWPPIDINVTRKYEKLCIVAFNRKFDYDDVRKLTN